MSKPRIAFFGLGLMGSGMARRLLAAGFPLTVYNRNRDKADALAKEGARAAASPREAAAQADVMVSMVADDNARAQTSAPQAGGNGQIWSQEYWAKKGDVPLWMFRKRLGAPQAGEAARPVLERVRATIRKALPRAAEGISYRIPVYRLDGVMVLYFAGFKQHYSIYPASARLVGALGKAFRD